MKKLIILLALSLPLMAQEAEAKETVGKKSSSYCTRCGVE